MSKNIVKQKLEYLLKWMKFIGPVTMKFNQSTNRMELKTFQYILNIILMIITVTWTAYLLFSGNFYDESYTIKTKLLSISFILSVLSRYGFALYDYGFNKNSILHYWNRILNLDSTCRSLKLQCIVNTKGIFITVVIFNFVDCFAHAFQTFNLPKISLSVKFAMVIGNLTTKILISMLAFLFLTLITMFKNYFKQLNEKLIFALETRPRHSLFIVNNIAKLHQYFYELTIILILMWSLHILTAFCSCLITLIINTHNVIGIIITQENNVFGLIESLWAVIEGCFQILVIIIPCNLCMEQVMHNKCLNG